MHPAISPSLPSSWSLPLSPSLPCFPHGSAGLLLPTPARQTAPQPRPRRTPSTHSRAHLALPLPAGPPAAAPAHHTAQAPGARGTPGTLLGCPGLQRRPAARFGTQPKTEIPAAASSGSALSHHTMSRVPHPRDPRPRPQPAAPAVLPHPLRTPKREPRWLRSPPALTADGHKAQTPPRPPPCLAWFLLARSADSAQQPGVPSAGTTKLPSAACRCPVPAHAGSEH